MRFAAGQSDPFRVLVCGGRDFKDAALVDRALSSVSHKYGFLHVIHGGARGADKLADAWACENGCDISEFPANWKADGKAAGPIRNQRMLDDSDPQLVVAFPGGTGTADMIRRAEKAGVRVWEPAKPAKAVARERCAGRSESTDLAAAAPAWRSENSQTAPVAEESSNKSTLLSERREHSTNQERP